MDLQKEIDIEKLRRLGIKRLELSRYRVNSYFGRGSMKRKKVDLSAPVQQSTNIYNVISETLVVEGYRKSFPHDIYTCDYSEENKKNLLELVEKFNRGTVVPE